MGAIGLGGNRVWGASGSAVLMLLRFARGCAQTDEVASTLDGVIAANGFGLDLGQLNDPVVRSGIEKALRDGALAMAEHLDELAALARQLESELSREAR